MIVAGAGVVAVGARMSRYGRRHTARIIERPAQLADESFVLFLRPFEEDQKLYKVRLASSRSLRASMTTPVSSTYEEGMVRLLRRRFGPVVAVGQPGEKLPLPGADRFYLPLDDWQPVVSDLIGRARLVVLIPGTSPGALWELTEAARLLKPVQLLLFVYGDETSYRRFQDAVPQAFVDRAEQLRSEGKVPATAPDFPDYPPLHDPTADGTMLGLQGIIHFDSTWTPRFVRCDRTAVKTLTWAGLPHKIYRKQLKPIFERVEQELPGEASSRFLGRRRLEARRRVRVRRPGGGIEGGVPRSDESGN
ncbi:hypothetical protein [Streptomyces sp. NPDC001657]